MKMRTLEWSPNDTVRDAGRHSPMSKCVIRLHFLWSRSNIENDYTVDGYCKHGTPGVCGKTAIQGGPVHSMYPEFCIALIAYYIPIVCPEIKVTGANICFVRRR